MNTFQHLTAISIIINSAGLSLMFGINFIIAIIIVSAYVVWIDRKQKKKVMEDG